LPPIPVAVDEAPFEEKRGELDVGPDEGLFCSFFPFPNSCFDGEVEFKGELAKGLDLALEISISSAPKRLARLERDAVERKGVDTGSAV
jgi:hypothetical protein